MRLLIYANIILSAGICLDPTYKYEHQQNYGKGKPIILNYRRMMKAYPYPDELPSSSAAPYIRSPYHNLYQGSRRLGDRRVYNKKFKYGPKENVTGHRMYNQGMFDCILSHVAIETIGSIPIILKGGVGYNHFVIIVKGSSTDELSGRIRAYCHKEMTSPAYG
ncbi:unnamed protein product [Leptidea sinapis]|uniref:Uncharacterized protein n=1 Tax=Leptidea sinapis TaxID=189913 RepID=A0A5E4PYD3_9NEOP|nr:unnamed protein product [Leptidea sinapis]